MKDYNEMSDFEINKLVAEKLGVDAKIEDGRSFTSKRHAGENVISVTTVTDYCNNPSDMWPLIVESKISILPWNEQMWQAWFTDSGLDGIKHRVFDKNPLRAAAIVFLMIKDEK